MREIERRKKVNNKSILEEQRKAKDSDE